jgi:putative hydrolase of HD superfamily
MTRRRKSPLNDSSLEEAILRFSHEVGKAKNLVRTGWREKVGVKSPESVADHMYRTAVISMVISDLEGLDTEKVLRMSILDDLAETVTGDLTPNQKRSYGLARTRQREENALKKLLSPLPRSLSERYSGIWKEAQLQRSKEARLVKSSDKLEMAIQATEYMQETYDAKKLEEFITSAGAKIEGHLVGKVFNSLKKKSICSTSDD